MADFRRWLYAFAVVALLAGLTVPASAQNQIQCQTNTSVPPVIRSQAYADLVGDLVLSCTGGIPTPAGQPVPQANITIFLTTNITSKLLGPGGAFSEALLIMDDPNSPGPNSNRPILNCGAPGAADSSPSGPGICEITSTGNPQQTYDGTPGVGVCNGSGVSIGYGCGRPNVFQGRPALNGGLSNAIVFLGVPLDPPGTGTTRGLRITNVRADAELLGVSGNFTTNSITMNIAVNGNTSLSINNPAQIVAYIQNGLTVAVRNARLDFIQCVSENPRLATGTPTVFNTPPCGGGGCNFPQPAVRFSEGFATSFKPRNLSEVVSNGTVVGGVREYNGNINCGSGAGGPNVCDDNNQNVPGTINYNTETGFSYTSNAATLSPNPPAGIGNGTVTNNNAPFSDASTGINAAGVATQGTRLSLVFANIPNGSTVWVPPVLYLWRQGVPTPPPTVPNPAAGGGTSTGVAVLTATAADGSGAYSPPLNPLSETLQAVSISGGSGLAVYEILFADPSSLENLDVPVVVAYVSNLSANPPGGLPVVNQISTVTGGFAPFYTSAAARLPSATLPVPRFVPGTAALNLFEINKCACNLLWPFVTVQSGFDTGLAIANASLDTPVPGLGIAVPQQGTVTYYYFGTSTNVGGAPPQPQTSNIVPAGQVITYDMFSGGGQIGANPNGLDNRANGFQGYVISQAQFQYCHGYAFISILGSPFGVGSSGYQALVLDPGQLPRSIQTGEPLAH